MNPALDAQQFRARDGDHAEAATAFPNSEHAIVIALAVHDLVHGREFHAADGLSGDRPLSHITCTVHTSAA